MCRWPARSLSSIDGGEDPCGETDRVGRLHRRAQHHHAPRGHRIRPSPGRRCVPDRRGRTERGGRSHGSPCGGRARSAARRRKPTAGPGRRRCSPRRCPTDAAWRRSSGSRICCVAEPFYEVGGYQEALHFYGEEKGLCAQFLKAGYQVVYMPDVLVAHVPDPGGRSTARYLRYVVRNDCLFALHYLPWPAACVSLPVRLARYFLMKRGHSVRDPAGFRLDRVGAGSRVARRLQDANADDLGEPCRLAPVAPSSARPGPHDQRAVRQFRDDGHGLVREIHPGRDDGDPEIDASHINLSEDLSVDRAKHSRPVMRSSVARRLVWPQESWISNGCAARYHAGLQASRRIGKIMADKPIDAIHFHRQGTVNGSIG